MMQYRGWVSVYTILKKKWALSTTLCAPRLHSTSIATSWAKPVVPSVRKVLSVSTRSSSPHEMLFVENSIVLLIKLQAQRGLLRRKIKIFVFSFCFRITQFSRPAYVKRNLCHLTLAWLNIMDKPKTKIAYLPVKESIFLTENNLNKKQPEKRSFVCFQLYSSF